MTFLLDMLQKGGITLYFIAICGLVAIIVFLKKLLQFNRAQVNVDELITGLVNVLRRDGQIEAITLCDHTPGPVARLLASAIHAYQDGDDISHAIEDQSLIEVPRLEAHLNVLATIAYISPLLGLLGTVVGMMNTFNKIQEITAFTLTDLSQGISTALICTAGGLVVAIPCHLAYNFLLTKVQAFCVEMERASSSILAFFQHHAQEKDKHEN